jgi:hypothetical protein
VVTWIKSPKDFWAGVLYMAFGLATVLIALSYSPGTAGRMGPGYFPRGLGSLMILLGAFLSLRAMRINGSRISLGSPKPLLVVLGSVVLFGLTIPLLGMAAATVLLVIAVGVFAYGLGVQMPIWPPFLQ